MTLSDGQWLSSCPNDSSSCFLQRPWWMTLASSTAWARPPTQSTPTTCLRLPSAIHSQEDQGRASWQKKGIYVVQLATELWCGAWASTGAESKVFGRAKEGHLSGPIISGRAKYTFSSHWRVKKWPTSMHRFDLGCVDRDKRPKIAGIAVNPDFFNMMQPFNLNLVSAWPSYGENTDRAKCEARCSSRRNSKSEY